MSQGLERLHKFEREHGLSDAADFGNHIRLISLPRCTKPRDIKVPIKFQRVHAGCAHVLHVAGNDRPKCYARLADTFAWDQSVKSSGAWTTVGEPLDEVFKSSTQPQNRTMPQSLTVYTPTPCPCPFLLLCTLSPRQSSTTARQPAQQLTCPAMSLAIPQEFFTPP